MSSEPSKITDAEPNPIDQREIACMRGHQEAKQRLLSSRRWDQYDVEESYYHFARCVRGEIVWDREHDTKPLLWSLEEIDV